LGFIAASPDGRHRREFGERRLEPGDAAALLVDADPERQIGIEPRGFEAELGELFGLDDVSREQDHPAQPEFARQRSDLDRERRTVEPGDEQLTDLPAETGR